jgi:uncharacterized protein YggU (UPF0235/DUF167 family)
MKVYVADPAADGKANEALLEAVSAALGLPRRSVRIVSGANARMKVLELEADDPQVLAALAAALVG